MAAEVRSYRLVGDMPAYRSSCGECGFAPYMTRARVEGTFEVELDSELGIGRLLSLDADLRNVEGLFEDGQWQPYGPDREFLGPQVWYDRYRPPFPGEFGPAEYRPLGANTWTHEGNGQFNVVRLSEVPPLLLAWQFGGMSYEPAPANSWMLSFDGLLPNPDGSTVSLVASYNIYFEGNEALFSYNVPIIDAVQWISAARAILIPEPTGMTMACLAIGGLVACHRRR